MGFIRRAVDTLHINRMRRISVESPVKPLVNERTRRPLVALHRRKNFSTREKTGDRPAGNEENSCDGSGDGVFAYLRER